MSGVAIGRPGDLRAQPATDRDRRARAVGPDAVHVVHIHADAGPEAHLGMWADVLAATANPALDVLEVDCTGVPTLTRASLGLARAIVRLAEERGVEVCFSGVCVELGVQLLRTGVADLLGR